MQCAPWASNGPNHLGLRALQDNGAQISFAMMSEQKPGQVTHPHQIAGGAPT